MMQEEGCCAVEDRLELSQARFVRLVSQLLRVRLHDAEAVTRLLGEFLSSIRNEGATAAFSWTMAPHPARCG